MGPRGCMCKGKTSKACGRTPETRVMAFLMMRDQGVAPSERYGVHSWVRRRSNATHAARTVFARNKAHTRPNCNCSEVARILQRHANQIPRCFVATKTCSKKAIPADSGFRNKIQVVNRKPKNSGTLRTASSCTMCGAVLESVAKFRSFSPATIRLIPSLIRV